MRLYVSTADDVRDCRAIVCRTTLYLANGIMHLEWLRLLYYCQIKMTISPLVYVCGNAWMRDKTFNSTVFGAEVDIATARRNVKLPQQMSLALE